MSSPTIVLVSSVLTVAVIGMLLSARPVSPAGPDADCSIRRATLAEPGQKTAEVSTEELQQVLADGRAVVFDARPQLEWAVSHIPGALNVAPRPGVPMSQYVSDVAEVGRLTPRHETPIVLYCNGPYCGKSKRLAEELLAGGYTNVRRYQLGIPAWRALVGITQIEPAGIRYVLAADHTAVFIDARTAHQFEAGSLPGARNISLAAAPAEIERAKNDGRLPMEDHNTRVIVLGADGSQARALAELIARSAFHNVAFYDRELESLETILPVGPR